MGVGIRREIDIIEQVLFFDRAHVLELRCGGAEKTRAVARDGFSLNAAVACQVHQRDKLER